MSAPADRRSTSNSNRRGNSTERAHRRAWLVTVYGDGATVLCFHCGAPLGVATVSCDRIRPGVLGGTYARENIRPSCLDCNVSEGGRLGRALQLGVAAQPIKLTLPQHRALIRIRCNPSPRGWTRFPVRSRRTLEVLGRHSLIRWWGNPDGVSLLASPVNPLVHEGVAR